MLFGRPGLINQLKQHCNATGSYSSFTGLSPNTDFSETYNEETGESINLHEGLPDLTVCLFDLVCMLGYADRNSGLQQITRPGSAACGQLTSTV